MTITNHLKRSGFIVMLSAILSFVVSDLSAQQSLPKRIQSAKDGAEMILIPEGEFVSGINQDEIKKLVLQLKKPMLDLYKTEFPKKSKSLRNYYIDRYEVTNEKYGRFVKQTGHRQSKYLKWPQFNGKDQPVVGVGWADAEAYCTWAGKRLPTEDEWEKAARGTDGRMWPWGNTPDDDKYNGKKQGNFSPLNVGRFPTGNSPYGVCDMAGNVWEMTSGTWERKGKAMRGGSFLNIITEVRVTVCWASSHEQDGADYLGFRCVMDVEKLKEFSRGK